MGRQQTATFDEQPAVSVFLEVAEVSEISFKGCHLLDLNGVMGVTNERLAERDNLKEELGVDEPLE